MKLFLNTPLFSTAGITSSKKGDTPHTKFGGYIKNTKRVIRASKKANEYRKSRKTKHIKHPSAPLTSEKSLPRVGRNNAVNTKRLNDITQTLSLAVLEFKNQFDSHYKQNWLSKLEHFFFEVNDAGTTKQAVYTNPDGITMTPESAGRELIDIHARLTVHNVEDTFLAMLDVFHDVHHMYIHFKNNQFEFPESMKKTFLMAAQAVDIAAKKQNLNLVFPADFMQY